MNTLISTSPSTRNFSASPKTSTSTKTNTKFQVVFATEDVFRKKKFLALNKLAKNI